MRTSTAAKASPRSRNMKRPRAGSLFLLLTSDELLARLATLVPPPRVHGLRYQGLC